VRKGAEKELDRRLFAEPPGGEAPTDVSRTVVQGKAHRQIVAVAEQHGVDLIVMGVHGHGALDRMVFGSTTHQVVRAAPCPVLSVRPPAGSEP
jgi:nucleotide-binding universal stress UspA family protein